MSSLSYNTLACVGELLFLEVLMCYVTLLCRYALLLSAINFVTQCLR